MDDVVDRMSDAADQAQVQLMISMGATSEQVEATEARLAEKRASKQVARDGLPPPAPLAAVASAAPAAAAASAALTAAGFAAKRKTGWSDFDLRSKDVTVHACVSRENFLPGSEDRGEQGLAAPLWRGRQAFATSLARTPPPRCMPPISSSRGNIGEVIKGR